MPRFLNTWTGNFEWHSSPYEVPYAILSHTWRLPQAGGEQSYTDILELQASLKSNRGRDRSTAYTAAPVHYSEHGTIFAHPELSDKIKRACKIARDAGFRLIWIDSCCIDKSSSAELSEAINSMFQWYELSDICYAYLEDVPDGDDPTDSESHFQSSRWHTRCWTLQELIAPAHVEFLTKSWRLLGTKMGLAKTLELLTGIDFTILTGQAAVDSASVARRMSWAADREATRVEDEAYSLMGIFHVHMTPIYGEGQNAFLRLQEEIVKVIPDQSIFSWGSSCVLRSSRQHYPIPLPFTSSSDPGLFASGAWVFKFCRGITPITPSCFAELLGLDSSKNAPSLHCVLTAQGVRVQLLCLKLAAIPEVRRKFWTALGFHSQCSNCMLRMADTFAILQCQDHSGYLIALPLYQLQGGPDGGCGMAIGTHIRCSGSSCYQFRHHTIRLSKEALKETLEHTSHEVVDVSLLRSYVWRPSTYTSRVFKFFRKSATDLAFWPDDGRESRTVFRIAPRSVEALHIMGFVPKSPLQVVRSERKITVRMTLTTNLGGADASLRGMDWRWEWPHDIQLTLTLTQPDHQTLLGETTAHFSIVNFVGVFIPDSPPLSPSSPPDPLFRIDTRYTMEQTPSFDGCENVERRSTFASQEVSSRIIADTEFTIYANDNWKDDTGCLVRFLRVALERPPEDLVRSDQTSGVLWLSVQISQQYAYIRSVDKYLASLSPEQSDDSSGFMAPSQSPDRPPENLEVIPAGTILGPVAVST